MTLAIKDSQGRTWIGGVLCRNCDRDRCVSADDGRCMTCGFNTQYVSRGLVIKVIG